MTYEKLLAIFKGLIIIHINETDILQADFARNNDMAPSNFNVWLNSTRGMRLVSFCDMYMQMGGELQDIIDMLCKRQAEKREKEQKRKQQQLKPGIGVQLALEW